MKIKFKSQLTSSNFQQLFFFWCSLLIFSDKNYFHISLKKKSFFFFLFFNPKVLYDLSVKNTFFLLRKSFEKINRLLILSNFKYFFLKYSNIELINSISSYFFINLKLHVFKKIIFINQMKNFQFCVKLLKKIAISVESNFLYHFEKLPKMVIINLMDTCVYYQFGKYFLHIMSKIHFQRNDRVGLSLFKTLLYIKKNTFLNNLVEKKKIIYVIIYFKKTKKTKKNIQYN